MVNQAFLGSGAVVAAALLWSLDGYLRQQLFSLPPTVVIFWEHLIGLIVLAPIVFITLRKFRQISRQQWMAMALVAFLSGTLGTVLYTAALGKIQFIQFSVVVLLQQLQPIFAIAAAAILLREPLGRRFFLLAAVALVAAYFVSFPHLTVTIIREQGGTALAALMALGAAAAWGISTAFSKFSLRSTSFLHVTAVRFGLVPVFALIMTAMLGQTQQLTAVAPIQWRYIIAITFSTGLVALAIYYFGLQRVPASRSTLLELAWPLSAVIVGFLFLGDRLTATQWIGSAVLVIAMVLVARDARQIDTSRA